MKECQRCAALPGHSELECFGMLAAVYFPCSFPRCYNENKTTKNTWNKDGQAFDKIGVVWLRVKIAQGVWSDRSLTGTSCGDTPSLPYQLSLPRAPIPGLSGQVVNNKPHLRSLARSVRFETRHMNTASQVKLVVDPPRGRESSLELVVGAT